MGIPPLRADGDTFEDARRAAADAGDAAIGTISTRTTGLSGQPADLVRKTIEWVSSASPIAMRG